MKKYSGFTLLELIITVGIIGVVTAIAIPSMRVYVQNDRLTSQINTLVSHLSYARSEAVTQSVQISVCASNNTINCSGANTWASGWIVFADTDASGAIDGSEVALRIQHTLGGNNTLTSTIGGQVIYDNRGFATTVAGTFSLCDDRGTANIKAIAIANTGRVRKVQASENPAC
jgi:type IV fimbrial biogenesis protein FimT